MFAVAGATLSALPCFGNTERPNFLIIMLDDFGIGQFAPMAEMITEEMFDPAAVQYFAEQPGEPYSNQEALIAARKAMPTMSRLSRNGLLFSNAFTSSPLCAPSRCGLATGIHQSRFGIYENSDANAWPGVLPPERILARSFKDAGYATGHIGKWHLAPLDDMQSAPILEKHGLPAKTNVHSLKKDNPAYIELEHAGFYGSTPDYLHPLNNGFDYYFGYNFHETPLYDSYDIWENFSHAGKQERFNTEVFTEKAIQFVQASIKEKKPFLLNVHYHAVHGPLVPDTPPEYLKPFEGMPFILANFYSKVFAADEGIRRLVETLEQAGLLDNTLIVFTSDNGTPIYERCPLPGNAPHRGHKGNYFLGGIHVPLVMYWPARIKEGRQTDELVSLLDIMPTAMNAAGISVPENLDGKSLLPLMDGGENGPHEYLTWFGLHSRTWGFSRVTAPGWQRIRQKEPGSWTVVNKDWILRFTGQIIPGMYNDYPEGSAPQYELYSMQNEPGETVNCFEQHPEIAAQLRSVAAKRIEDTLPPAKWNREKWQELRNSFDE